VLVFRDIGINAYKWVLWDISPGLHGLPANISHVAAPAEVPGASQLGSLNNVGYAGPQRANQEYDFTLYALNVDRLQGTQGLSTEEIFENLLPAVEIAHTDPVVVVNAQ